MLQNANVQFAFKGKMNFVNTIELQWYYRAPLEQKEMAGSL